MEKVNNISVDEWIDINLKDFVDGNVTFIEAGQHMARHNRIEVVFLRNDLIKLKLKNTCETIISISNPLDDVTYAPEDILNAVSQVSGFHIDTLKTRSRKRELSEARFAYFSINLELKDKQLSTVPLETVGALVDRSHSDVVHTRKVEHLTAIRKIVDDAKKILSL